MSRVPPRHLCLSWCFAYFLNGLFMWLVHEGSWPVASGDKTALRLGVRTLMASITYLLARLKSSADLQEAGKTLGTGKGSNKIPQTHVHLEPHSVTLLRNGGLRRRDELRMWRR